ncbi:transporter substrate-binding domain-containing protein [Spirulina sp. CCNP1310]|uniref:transporter substrate-binding domain-containing protein n=1 Tax=Spirulina sp. CCNP1310 TaxID=3110249 RepID=UPI002B1EB7ED|nr:transporter substrate-binding domain-containing protein [Spirulina sp. CCNP1310]MEA5418945.1 transporter substrate-binding domain-containing protein [Spirulina sp. CCNP1310]
MRRLKTGLIIGGMAMVVTMGITPLSLFPCYATEWAEIEARGKLIVAVKDNTRPLGFRDPDGVIRGLEIDLARQLALMLLGNRDAVEFVPVSNGDRLDILHRGEVDFVIAGLTVTPMRSRLVYFTRPYHFDSTSLITRQPSITQLADLRGQRVALLQGSSAIAALRHRAPDVTLVGVDSYQEAMTLLATGEAAAFAGDRTILTGWSQIYPEYRVLGDRLSSEPLGVAIAKTPHSGRLLITLNQALQALEQSGWLAERRAAWGLTPAAP